MAKDEYVPFTGKLDAAPQFEPFDGTLDGKEPTLTARVKQGASRAVDSARTALTDDPNKIAQIAAEQSRNALPQSAAQRQMAEEFAPYVDAANKAEGVVDNVKAWGAAGFKRAGQLLSNPGEAAKMVAEQLPNSIPALAGGFAGAKAGAALGTAVAPGVGTAVGGVLGGIAGGFAGGYGLEKGAAMQEQVQKEAQAQKIDLRDEAAVAKMVAQKHPEFDAAAQRKGVGTAGTDALLNVATMGLAGVGGRTLAKEARTLADAVKAGTVSAADAATDLARLQSVNAARNTLGAKALRGAGVVGAEMAGEGLSEGVGQKFAYGSVDAGEVIDESLMGLGTGGAMALGSKAFNKAAGIVDQDATTQNLAAARDGLAALGPALTTAPGAVDPNAPQTPPAAPPEAPDLTTFLGAGVAKDGLDFTRDVDTSGLSLQDPAELARQRAATVDYQPGDTTPQWDTQPGAAAPRTGLDMPAPEFDTGSLGIDNRTPSERMGLDPAKGPLTSAAALAVDTGASPVQFLGATGRDMQLRQTGPGVADESNVIDVQGRVVEDRAIGTPRRLTAQDGARESGAIAFQDGVPRSEIAAIPNIVARAEQLRGYDEAAQKAAQPLALPAPSNLREGLERIRAQREQAARTAQVPPTTGVARESQASQTQQGSTQPTQAGGPQAGAAAATASTVPAGGNRVQAAGVEPAAKDDASIQSWRNAFESAKKADDRASIQSLYDNVRVVLNGIAQKHGEKAVSDFQALKAEIEIYAKSVAPIVQPEKQGQAAPSAQAAPQGIAPAAASQQSQPQPSKEVRLTGIDKEYARLTQLRGTKVMLTHPDGRILYDVQLSVPWRRKNMIGTYPMQRFQFTENFEVKSKSDVTGNPGDEGFVLIDKRAQNAQRAAQNPTVAPASQAQQAAPAAGPAPTNTAAPTPAGASTVRALSDGTPTQNPGAQAAPAAGTQAQAPQTAVARPDGWRKSMLRAAPIARAMGIDPKGKRLAQVVAEIDAADAQSGGAVNTMRGLAQQFRDRHAITKQDTDRTFAAVLDQFAGEVEQGKRTPQSVQQAIARYQELAAQPVQATHADPGEKAEAATSAVVTDSLKTAARNEDTKPSEMRKWLVAEIDRAMLDAPEKDATEFVSFDVPGDGVFKVQKSRERLLEFRKKVMASPGFKDGGQKQAKPQQNDSILNSGGTAETIRAFLVDGDVQGAVEFAKLKGVEFTPVPPQMKMSADGKGKVKHMPASVKSSVPSVAEALTQVEAEQLNQYLTAEQARAEPADAQDAAAQQSPAATKTVAQPITRADVAAAQQQAAQPQGTAEQAIRDAFQALPSVSLGEFYPITVQHNGREQQFLASQRAIKRGYQPHAALTLLQIRRGRMIAGDDLQDIAYTYKLNGKNELTEESVRPASDELIKRWSEAFAPTAESQPVTPLLTAQTPEEIVARQDAAEAAKREQEVADRKARESDYASTAEQVEAAQELLLPIRQGEMITDDVRQTLESLLKISSLKGFDQPTARRLLMIAGATKAAIEKVMRTNPVSIDDLATELGKATGEAEKKKAFDRAFNAASQIAQTDPKVKELLDIYNVEKSILDGIASERGLYGVKWAERNVSSRWTGQSQKVRSVKQRLVDAVNKAAPSGVRQSDASAAPAPKKKPSADQTRADVAAAQQQAAAIIGARIDAMTAGEVNSIAKKFLPTMGMKPTMSKANNKAAMTDAAKVNLMAAAAEVGVKLPADVRRALDAEMQGKVADAGQDDGLAARADGDDDYLRTLFGGSDTAEQDAVSPAQTQKIDAKAAVPMLRALAQEKRAEAEDWSGRKYKGNKSQVNLRGDGPSNQETMSVSAVNESRRRKAVESLVAQANAADKLADRIESGSINIQSALDNISSAVDSDMKRDGGKPSIGKSRQDMFEGYISSQLLADPYAGYGNGTVSSALRAMYEERVADVQPAVTYINGDRAEYTGNTETIGGGLFYEVRFTEGAKNGKTAVTQRAPDGANPSQRGPVEPTGIVTPQLSGNPAQFIKIAADSIKTLRKVDVDRVLTETPAAFRQEVAAYIRDQRKDLADEVSEVMADLADAKQEADEQPARADNRKKVKQGAGEAPPVTDFGEKLEGARKDMPPSLKEDVSDEQIANLPLSKVWPSDAHESIEDAAAAALVFAARQEIPAKPRVPSRVREWVSKVKMFREVARDLSGRSLEGMERHISMSDKFKSLAPFFAKVRLLSQLPRDTWSRVERVEEYPNAIRYEKDGSKTAVAFSSVTIDGKSRRFEGVGKIGPDEVQKVKEMLGTAAPKKGGLTPADFEVRGTAKTGYKINRKGDSEYRSLKIFTGEDAAKKALAWRDEHTAELEAAWEAVKARDNVSKADIRRDENRERSGENRRNGKDVTEEMFDHAFGFRGVQFGNWVGQGAEARGRQGMLNDAYDALLDLADILGIPSKAISLNGTLGLSFGARGSGKAAAHFEPSNLVINLTKTRGAGSLAHEWFHALDNYFSRMRGGEVAFTGDNNAYRQNNYVTYKPEAAWGKAPITPYTNFMRGGQLRERLQRLPGFAYDANKTLAENAKAAGFERDPNHKDGVRPQVEKAFADLVQALNDSPMAERASALDKAADGYWGRIIERGARSFENYVISKMAQRGWSNDFLANIRSFDEWMAMGKNAERYPYLKPEEDAPVVEAFDKLFQTVETKEDDAGNVAMFSRAPASKGPKVTGLYSALSREIDALPTKSAPVMGWQMAITGLVKNGKIKADEVEWSGLNDWLQMQTGKVSKEDVTAYLDANGVQVQEVVLGGVNETYPDGMYQHPVTGDVDTLENWRAITEDFSEDGGESIDEQLSSLIDVSGEEISNNVDETKYGQYTLPGGENYREVLLTLPDGGAETVQDQKQRLKEKYGVDSWFDLTDAQKEDLRISDEKANRPREKYKSSHWEQPNVLAHIRVNDRVDADGKRVLFVEEIQSDWGQDGKKKGIAKSYKPEDVQPLSAVEAGKMTVADEELFWHFKTPDNIFSIPKSKHPDRDAARDYIIREKKVNSGGVLDAPFIGKTEGWLNLALKRVIAMAVDGGYDKVAFVTGQQSAERYDLSKQVDAIGYLKHDDGTVTIEPSKDGRSLSRDNYPADKLSDVVGMELAERIIQSSDDAGELSGLDLKVGGEGMIAFYDRIVPNAVKALVKKIGGGSLETVSIRAHEKHASQGATFGDTSIDPGAARIEKIGGAWRVVVEDMLHGVPFKTRREAQEYIDSNTIREVGQPGFTITPAMREKASGGLPMFTQASQQAPSRADSNARNVATQLLVDGLKAKWTRAPEIIVARNMQDAQIPQRVRDYDLELKSQGATGETRGFIYKGKVYLLSDQLKGPQQIAEVLFHEVLGHYGLRGAFGDSLNSILQQMGTMRRRDVVAKAREYGLFDKDALGGLDKAAASDSQIWAAMSAKDRLSAAEEVLAEMAQTQPNIGFVQRAIAAIRNWLRANVPGFKSLALTDNDIIQAYILPARGYVTRSKETGAQSLERAMAAFSRTPGDQTQTEAFKRWFGDSKVVDSEGKPLVVYHGTAKDFSEFDVSHAGQSTGNTGFYGAGAYFTQNTGDAAGYAGWAQRTEEDAPNLIPAYLSIQRPVYVHLNPKTEAHRARSRDTISALVDTLESEGFFGQAASANEAGSELARLRSFIEKADFERAMGTLYRLLNGGQGVSDLAQRAGFDGVLVYATKDGRESLEEAVAFRPEQIKSAIGNNGDFDPANPDIRRSATAQPPRTPAATIRAAITKAYGKLLGQLESKGLVTLTQTEDEAVEAAAQARAAKTGGDVEQIKRQMLASVQASVLGKDRIVYRGTTGSTERIKGGIAEGLLFAAAEESTARLYGPIIEGIKLKATANVLVEGTREFAKVTGRRAGKLINTMRKGENLKTAADEAVKLARDAGFDAVEFTSYKDLGIAIINESAVERDIDIKRSANGNIEGFFDRQTGKSFLVADNLTAASAPGTLMHEVGIHMAADGKLEPLFKRAGSLLKTGTQNEFIQRVKARMARAGETSDEEAAAYIVTEYENDRAKAPITIGKWMADLTAAVRAWLFGKGMILKAEQLTVADIAAVARANARSMARDGGATGGQGFGTAFSRTPGDQTQTEAFKRWFAGSRVVDADGKPLVVMHASTYGDISEFKKEAQRFGKAGFGFYFSDESGSNLFAEYGDRFQMERSASGEQKAVKTYPVYLSLQNPLVVDHVDDLARHLDRGQKFGVARGLFGNLPADAMLWLQRQGYDGIITRETTAPRVHKTRGLKILDRNDPKAVSFPVYVAFEPAQIKSAIGNNGNFDPANPDIRRSFAGQQAATADTMALATAQQRLEAGEDAETVRQETGWFKGNDGKWRFEIDDSRAFLKGTGTFGDVVMARMAALEQGGERKSGDPVRLGDVLYHHNLFSAYPALRDMEVQFMPRDTTAKGSLATDDAGVQVIQVRYELDNKEALSVLLHEIQHGIQTVEGFATGGNSELFASGPMFDQRARNLAADLGENLTGSVNAGPAEISIAAKYGDQNEMGEIARKHGFATVDEALSFLKSQDEKRTPFGQYRRLAGEVEARNTQARQKLTADQRRATSPGSTADVADADVIVVFNGKEMANAPMPANAAPDAATTAQPLRTPAATIRAAITKAYGKLLGQLESKGLVTLTQTQEQAIEAAAQARADKTGQPLAEVRASLMGSVSNSVVDQTQTEAFKRWFSGSKAVDAQGKPLRVYHGTAADFSAFDPKVSGSLTKAMSAEGAFWFSDSSELAGDYAALSKKRLGVKGARNIVPVYLSMKNPKVVDFHGQSYHELAIDFGGLVQTARKGVKSGTDWVLKPHDGMILRNFSDTPSGRKLIATHYVVFRPEQIKSAIGNNGNFDPNDPDIRRSEDGAIQGFFDPQTGQSFLIADNLTAEAAPGVLMHEVGIHMAADGSMKALFNRAAMMLKMQRGNPFIKAVQARMDAAGETSGEEAAAYIAEAYENDRANAPASVQRWLSDLLAAVKAWMFKKGIMGANRLTVADVAAVARANARSMARASVADRTGDGDVQFSRASQAINNTLNERKTVMAGPTSRAYTPEQQAAMRNVGLMVEQPSLKERAQALWQDAGKKLAQGIVDQFAPVKEISKDAYALLRLSKGASGAFETLLKGGKLKLSGGVYDFDEANKGGVVDALLTPLNGEHHDFLRWVAANRAERLMGEDRERLFTPEDIAALKTLADGDLSFDFTLQHGPRKGKTTRNRAEAYKDSLTTFNAFNKNVLDMAEQSGLIDPESRATWESEFYVPFYRVADEESGGVRGMNIKGSVVRQQAFKHLKGGKQALNNDLLDNTLMNWAHLLDASAKNRAAKATLEAAQQVGVAIEAPKGTLDNIASAIGKKNGIVWFMDGGQKRHFMVDDPYIMTAISSLEYAGMNSPIMNAMGAFKHALTIGVTASPFFKIRNLIRDSVQVVGTSSIGVNPLKNVADGWKLTDPKNDAYFRLLAGGGTIHFGTMLEGSEAKRVHALVESGVQDSTILNTDHKVKQFYRKYIEPGITAYNELGNRGEAVNRAALYDQLRKQGMGHAEASLQARDLMDFSMQGSFTSIRFLSQVVPFLNARLQGMYKLGRAANENPKRMAYVTGAVAMASLALLAAYGDDDDWKRREDWDRNNFWWFKVGGIAFRIPKPFELGAIGTLAERSAEYLMDDEMTGKRFRGQVLKLLGDNLSMNPIPQAVKPILDVYANKDSFRNAPIESMGMERMKPEYRFNDRTSMVARGLSTAANSVTGLVGADALSPVQIDHLLRGYFGWLGTFAVGAADMIARPVTNQPTQATQDIWKKVTGGIASQLEDAPSRYVSSVYEQAKELEQAYGTWRALQKSGKPEEAAAFFSDNYEEIARYRSVMQVKTAEGKLNERIRQIERSTEMDGDAKREAIRNIRAMKEALAKRLAPA